MNIARCLEGVNMNRASRAQKTLRSCLDYCAVKTDKPWFSEESSKLLNQRKQRIFSACTNANQMSGNESNNVRLGSSRSCGNKTGISETDSKTSYI